MSVPDADEDFEFLVNLLASDGVDPDPPPRTAGPGQVAPDLRIQSGSDSKLDLGQVKAYYENKHMGVGVRDDGPGLTDHHQPPTNRSGSWSLFVMGAAVVPCRAARFPMLIYANYSERRKRGWAGERGGPPITATSVH
jgi:hypothetical protein